MAFKTISRLALAAMGRRCERILLLHRKLNACQVQPDCPGFAILVAAKNAAQEQVEGLLWIGAYQGRRDKTAGRTPRAVRQSHDAFISPADTTQAAKKR